ncbi:MAG: TIGR04282 family arsenosugar biosynthesis glycosyltransferase [Opitutales bacterium]
MLKAPEPGQVKTRLAAVLGPESAATAYTDMVDFLWARLRLAPRVDHVVGFAPVSKPMATLFRTWFGPRPTLIPQRGQDLGERMFQVGRHAGALFPGQHRVFIGGDCPYLETLHLEAVREAFRSGADASILPSHDGGYVLLAVRADADPGGALFRDIDWGTDRVARQTRERARSAGLNLAVGPALDDVDEPADWERARAYLASRAD